MTCKRILLVDDETDIQEIVQLCLETTLGWQVAIASSGVEALSLAVIEQPDAILLDLMMPELDGSSTLAKLQANPATKNIPVIFLTANIDENNQHKFSQVGLKGIIEKPFKLSNLASQIAQLLGWHL